MIRFSLIFTGLIALFWFFWHFINGSVPEISSVKISNKLNLELGFSISRWWDVLLVPFWTSLLVWIFTAKNLKDNEPLTDQSFGLCVGLIVGFTFGLISLDIGLIMGLVFGLITSSIAFFNNGSISGLKAGMGSGLGFGLVSGIEIGLATGLIIGLLLSTSVSLIIFLIYGIYNWLLAK